MKRIGGVSVLAAIAVSALPAGAAAAESPSIKAAGYKTKGTPTCDLSAKSPKKSFRFTGSGFTPGVRVMVVVQYPKTVPSGANQVYKQANSGVLTADENGRIQGNIWTCWSVSDSPGNDPPGKYRFFAVEMGSPHAATTGYEYFRVVE